MGVDVAVLVLGGLAVLVGAVVQSSVGLGLGLVAAPVITLLEPDLMPGTLLLISAVLPLLTLLRESGAADWRGLGWAFLGRAVGTAGGVWLVAVVSPRGLSVFVGATVVVAVVLSTRDLVVPLSRATLLAAGAVAGVTGTATSIGGPPMALLYQHESGPRIRSTLAVFFVVGAIASLAALTLVGEVPARAMLTGAVLLPFLVVGFALSARLRRYLDEGRTRRAVLAVAGISGAVLVIRGLA